MEKRVTVLYKQGLAQYDVQGIKNGCFVARLYRYNGKENTPPNEIEMCKEGRHWKDDKADQDLVDDIGYAIEYDNKPPDKPVVHLRGSNGAEGSRDTGREVGGGKP
jgi:hypothetical protein